MSVDIPVCSPVLPSTTRQRLLLGGAYDTVPEVCMLLAVFNHSKDYHPVVFDEAGMIDTLGPMRTFLTSLDQDIELQLSTCYPPLKDRCPPSTSLTTEKLILTFRAIQNSG